MCGCVKSYGMDVSCRRMAGTKSIHLLRGEEDGLGEDRRRERKE